MVGVRKSSGFFQLCVPSFVGDPGSSRRRVVAQQTPASNEHFNSMVVRGFETGIGVNLFQGWTPTLPPDSQPEAADQRIE
jgi:hypothetical protein